MQAQASCDLGYISDAYFQIPAHIPETAGVVVGKGLAGELQTLGVVQRIFAFGMHGLIFRDYMRETAIRCKPSTYWIVLCKILSGKVSVLTCATKKGNNETAKGP